MRDPWQVDIGWDDDALHPRGWIPPSLGRTDECMRQSFSCVTGINPAKLNHVDPQQKFSLWAREWSDLARAQHGWDMLFVSGPNSVDVPDGLWIAIVPSLSTKKWSHAIVMKGQRLYWDCNRIYPRKRRPTKFERIVLLREIA